MANSVQHNISALNANRNFGITKGILKSSTEKLSSGYKINRAADDAAGLSISEKMRRQIRGLTQASANAQDGISSVQTAEGALTEVHAMLQRMDELATKASNGSNSKDDRQFVQDELNQLMTEIDRVAETTKFNETYLLKGKADKSTTTKTLTAKDAGLAGTLDDDADSATATFKLDKALVADSSKITIAGKEYKIVSSNTANYSAVPSAAANARMSAVGAVSVTDPNGNVRQVVSAASLVTDSSKYVLNDVGVAAGDTITQSDGTKITFTTNDPKTLNDDVEDASTSGGGVGSIKNVLWGAVSSASTKTEDIIVTHADGNKDTYKMGHETDSATTSVEDVFSSLKEGDTVQVGTGSNPPKYSIVGKSEKTKEDELTVEDAYDKIKKELIKANSIGADAEVAVDSQGNGSFTINKGTVTVKKSLDFNLHVGADADMTNKINVKIDAMDTKGLGISGLNVVDDDGTKATYALDSIEAAIKTVSQQRSALGAAQNRLEHTIKNVDNVVENTTSAESAIRDTDMATEMVKFSNANILAQAGQSMLAQANQQNQGILSLLG